MAENERQQELIERVQEDERLRGDLGGEAATALVAWATDKVRDIAADPNRPDDMVSAEAQAVRKSARKAANSGEQETAKVLALAEAALAEALNQQPASEAQVQTVQTDASQPQAAAAPETGETAAPEPAAPAEGKAAKAADTATRAATSTETPPEPVAAESPTPEAAPAEPPAPQAVAPEAPPSEAPSPESPASNEPEKPPEVQAAPNEHTQTRFGRVRRRWRDRIRRWFGS